MKESLGEKPLSKGEMKNSIRLRSGGYFDFANPKPDQFTIEDIAGALSKLCRFGGQSSSFYSVAEHLILCDEIALKMGCDRDCRRAVIMHDAAEAFCGDVVKPLKIMLESYAKIEQAVEDAVAAAFGIDFAKHKDVIHKIDTSIRLSERDQLFDPDGVTWSDEAGCERFSVNLNCWNPSRAEYEFLIATGELGISK